MGKQKVKKIKGKSKRKRTLECAFEICLQSKSKLENTHVIHMNIKKYDEILETLKVAVLF